MKYSTIALSALVGICSVGVVVSCYKLYRGKPTKYILVKLGTKSAKYRIITHNDGSMTITLMTELPVGFDSVYHNHLINGTTHGNFRSINEIVHFINTRHREINVTILGE